MLKDDREHIIEELENHKEYNNLLTKKIFVKTILVKSVIKRKKN